MATKTVNITPQAWVEIGSGPLLVEAKQSDNAYIHFGTQAPALTTRAHHDLSGPDSFSYAGSERCYARASKSNTTLVVTEGAA